MKKEQKRRLLKKGWSEEEVKKAETIMESEHLHDKSRSFAHSNKILFWGMLFVIIIGNALVSFVLIPMLLTFSESATSFFVFVIGFCVGLFFNFLVWDIEHISRRQHMIAVLLIPLISVLNLYAIVRITNAINTALKITAARDDPLVISAVYVVALLLPYLWTVFSKNKIKRYEY